MIITTKRPFTSTEVAKLCEAYGTYIKTVIDIKEKTCSAGAIMHRDSEKILLEKGSIQSNIWGGGIDLPTKIIDFNSFINIRPRDNNQSNEIQDATIREEYKRLTEYFFQAIYE